MLSATLPMSLKPQPAMSANASAMHALGFSRRLVPSGGRRLTAGVSMVRQLSVTPLTLRCSSLSSSSSSSGKLVFASVALFSGLSVFLLNS